MTCSERRCSTYHEPRSMVFRITMGLNLKSPTRNKPSEYLSGALRGASLTGCRIGQIVRSCQLSQFQVTLDAWLQIGLGYKSASKADAMAPNVTSAISVYSTVCLHHTVMQSMSMPWSFHRRMVAHLPATAFPTFCLLCTLIGPLQPSKKLPLFCSV